MTPLLSDGGASEHLIAFNGSASLIPRSGRTPDFLAYLLPILNRQDTAGHGVDQSLMVGFGLVRVRASEAA